MWGQVYAQAVGRNLRARGERSDLRPVLADEGPTVQQSGASTMFASHAPSGSTCPCCAILRDVLEPAGGIHRAERAIACVALHLAAGSFRNVLISPLEHFENLYVLPLHLAEPVVALAQAVARAMKSVLACDGDSLRQHYAPAGWQDVWHLHGHVTPRCINDRYLKPSQRRAVARMSDRAVLAQKLAPAVAGEMPAQSCARMHPGEP